MTSSLGRRRRIRILDEDERRLWETVAESIEPLLRDGRKRRRAAARGTEDADLPPPPSDVRAPDTSAAKTEPEASVAAGATAAPSSKRVVRPTGSKRWAAETPAMIHVKHAPRLDGLPHAVTAPPSLSPIDQRTRRRLVRGTIAIDERLDLHGLTQEAAHSALRHFLVGARARGARIVLVITGKGKGGIAIDAHDRGVLRRSVPHWLADPVLRDVVVGFEEAHLAHGGAGAIYVRLRRPHGPGEGMR